MKRRTNPTSSPQSPNANNLRLIQQALPSLVRTAVEETLVENGVIEPETRRLVMKAQYSAGPLPAPLDCQHYEAIYPGFTDRFISMAEKSQRDHAAAIRRRDLGEIAHKLGSLLSTSLIALMIVGGGIWLLSKDKRVEGFSTLGGAAATVIWAILRVKSPPPKPKD